MKRRKKKPRKKRKKQRRNPINTERDTNAGITA
jgi:hypothetical protein